MRAVLLLLLPAVAATVWRSGIKHDASCCVRSKPCTSNSKVNDDDDVRDDDEAKHDNIKQHKIKYLNDLCYWLFHCLINL